ncbi:MAG TPA: glycosyltransferase [Galbitalea sp.]|nr:glycosyltransferase [Galbitalea sp.]
MLVYFINHSTAPVNLGGAERSMITLVEDWYAADPAFEAFFLTKAPRGRFIEAIELRGWRYLALKYRGWAIPHAVQSATERAYFARDDYAATLGMIDVMQENRPDLVVTNTLVAPWGAFAAKALGIPHAWFIREYGDLDHGLTFQLGRERTIADIGLLSEAVFVNSRALREHVIAQIDEAKVSVVYPRVDVDSIAKLSKEQPASDPFPDSATAALKITMVGRLSETKGQLDVVAALGLLRDQGIDARLTLVGASEPPGFERVIQSAAREHGVADRLVIAGERDNPFPYVRAADVCVTASGIEAFGRTTLEYLALGKPVVASSAGGSAELVDDGKCGFLFHPSDTAGLAAALARYAADPALLETHGRAAVKRAAAIQSRPLDNLGAIQKMRAIATGPSYRLPNAAQLWFALLAADGAGRPRRGFTSIAVRRVRARLGRWAKLHSRTR